MIETLIISLKLKITYWINSRLYSIKQIPGVRRAIPDTVFGLTRLKSFLAILGTIREIIVTFFTKFLYFGLMIVLPVFFVSSLVEEEMELGEGLFSMPSDVFWPAMMQMLVFLTLAGAVMNNDFFDGSMDKYYAIDLLRFDPRKFTLVNYAYLLFRFFIGFIAVACVAVAIFDLPKFWIVLIPCFVVGSKLCCSAIELILFNSEHNYKKVSSKHANKKGTLIGNAAARGVGIISLIAVVVLIFCAYLLFFLNVQIPEKVIIGIMIAGSFLGALSIIKLVRFDNYMNFCRSRNADFIANMGSASTILTTRAKERIDETTKASSDKSGFEFLNEIFVKRHSKILWKRSKAITIVAAAISAGLAFVLMIPYVRAAIGSEVNRIIPRMLKMLPFALYFINNGEEFTRCLFMNSDSALLSYSFFKEPRNLLKLFRLRLREISKVNMLPALTIAVGLVALLFISGGTDTPSRYLLIFFTTLLTSVFFSVHYLVMYYLLQPYNTKTDVVSAPYRIVMFVTYFPCYMIMQVDVSPIKFGIFVVIFAALYSVIALVLAYKLAPRTFKLRT